MKLLALLDRLRKVPRKIMYYLKTKKMAPVTGKSRDVDISRRNKTKKVVVIAFFIYLSLYLVFFLEISLLRQF